MGKFSWKYNWWNINFGGVVLTLKKMDIDKQYDEKKKYPYIIPVEQKQVLKKAAKYSTNICEFIEVVNVGEQHALNVTLEYEECNYKVLEKWSLENKVSILEKEIYNELLAMEKTSLSKMQILIASDGNKVFNMNMPVLLQFLINFIVVNLIDNYYVKFKSYEDIPLGNLVFKFNNNIGKHIKNKYSLFINCFMDESESEEKECLITLSFKLQGDSNNMKI